MPLVAVRSRNTKRNRILHLHCRNYTDMEIAAALRVSCANVRQVIWQWRHRAEYLRLHNARYKPLRNSV